jgi:hypothetical protein
MKNYGYIEWTDTKETIIKSGPIITLNSETKSDFFHLTPIIKIVPEVINWNAFNVFPEHNFNAELTL